MAESKTPWPETDDVERHLSEIYRLKMELHIKDQKIAKLERENAKWAERESQWLSEAGLQTEACDNAEARAESLQAKVAELERELRDQRLLMHEAGMQAGELLIEAHRRAESLQSQLAAAQKALRIVRAWDMLNLRPGDFRYIADQPYMTGLLDAAIDAAQGDPS